MTEGYTMESVMETFDNAIEQVITIVEQLISPEYGHLEHGDVEARLARLGQELLRRLYQAFLDTQTLREQRVAHLTGSDNVVRTHVRAGFRRLETVFGTTTVIRLGYGARGHEQLHPLDRELNLPSDLHSHGMNRRAAELASEMSFEDATAELAKQVGGHASKWSIEQMAVAAAQDFDAYYAAQAVPSLSEPSMAESPPELLILSMDGKGINMVTEDLRERTRKAAEADRDKPRRFRLGSGEKANRKRMATVASVYDIRPHLRTAEQILAGTSADQPPRPRPTDKRVWASLEMTSGEVAAALFAEARKRDPQNHRTWALLVDGDLQQLHVLERAARDDGARVTIVLDFYHAVEYLWPAAYALEPPGSQAAQDWVLKQAQRLLEGKVGQVIASMRRSATKRGLTKTVRKGIDTCARYYQNHRQFMHYDQYLALGLPIGSGVIEGACKHVVKDRMEISGARWSLKGAEAVLRLRSLVKSHDFDDYWAFHCRAEKQRNHLSRYATEEMPLAA